MVKCPEVPDIISIFSGRILLGGGQVVFELAHTFW